jgi:hypothetical protein
LTFPNGRGNDLVYEKVSLSSSKREREREREIEPPVCRIVKNRYSKVNVKKKEANYSGSGFCQYCLWVLMK